MKGDKSLDGKDIIVTEAVVVFTDTKFINEALTPLWVPLQQDNEYLLLLKKVPFDTHRVLNNFQISQYYPVTSSAFGCYRLSEKNQTEPMDKGKIYRMDSLKGLDIFTYDPMTLNTYNQYKIEIFNKVGIR